MFLTRVTSEAKTLLVLGFRHFAHLSDQGSDQGLRGSSVNQLRNETSEELYLFIL